MISSEIVDVGIAAIEGRGCVCLWSVSIFNYKRNIKLYRPSRKFGVTTTYLSLTSISMLHKKIIIP